MSQEKVHAVVTSIFSTATAKQLYGDERRDDSLGATFFRSTDDLARESSLGVLNSLRTGLR